jgi:hypothetical protein
MCGEFDAQKETRKDNISSLLSGQGMFLRQSHEALVVLSLENMLACFHFLTGRSLSASYRGQQTISRNEWEPYTV